MYIVSLAIDVHCVSCYMCIFQRLNGFGPVIELQCAGKANTFVMMGSRGGGGGCAGRGCLDRHTLHTGTTARPFALCHSIKT
jgi:hypothetical protein